MTLKFILICAGSWMLVSCNSGSSSDSASADASGVYVREYAMEVTNPNTGDKIGMRQIRDSIFVEQADNAYKITNRKWRMNDYDQEGWINMQHADDRPFPVYMAAYDAQTKSLKTKEAKVSPNIFIDLKNGRLFKGNAREIEYLRVN